MRIVSATVLLVGLAASAAEPVQTYPQWDGKETVAEYAKRAKLEPTKTLDLGNGVKLELVVIPAGKFLMGSPETEKNRRPEETQHEVTLTKPYYMGKFEVTQEQYQQVMGTTPSRFKGRDLPVETVSSDDAQEFCKKTSERTGQMVRLPTEAEWERACRAGTKTTYCTGDTEADLDRAAWYGKNSGYTTHPVGEKVPNAWGLYDMHGNVWEWVQDSFEEYKVEAATDPQGPGQDLPRVLRGGSWGLESALWRSTLRSASARLRRGPNVGFRVAVEVAPRAP